MCAELGRSGAGEQPGWGCAGSAAGRHCSRSQHSLPVILAAREKDRNKSLKNLNSGQRDPANRFVLHKCV